MRLIANSKSLVTAYSLCLLRRHNVVKLHLKPWLRGGEKIVTTLETIANLKTALEFVERANRIGPWLPIRQRFRQRLNFHFRGPEPTSLPKHPHHRLKHFAIGPVLPLLGARFKVAVEPQDRCVVSIFSVGRKNAMQTAKNSFLPVDEGSVTIGR